MKIKHICSSKELTRLFRLRIVPIAACLFFGFSAPARAFPDSSGVDILSDNPNPLGPFYSTFAKELDDPLSSDFLMDAFGSGTPGSAFSQKTLGNGTNALGQPANAQAYSDAGGTYWASVNADNTPPLSSGLAKAGFASAHHTIFFTKDEENASITLDISGGVLALFDGGGGTDDLKAEVWIRANVINPFGNPDPAESDRDQAFGEPEYFAEATLSGRGGAIGRETFEFTSTFDVPVSYSEPESVLAPGNILEAALTIPAHTVPIDVSQVCLGCDGGLSVTVFAWALNPGGETAAFASLRDPLHVNSDDPTLGGLSFSHTGLTEIPSMRPVPLPSAIFLWLPSMLAIFGLRRKRS